MQSDRSEGQDDGRRRDRHGQFDTHIDATGHDHQQDGERPVRSYVNHAALLPDVAEEPGVCAIGPPIGATIAQTGCDAQVAVFATP